MCRALPLIVLLGLAPAPLPRASQDEVTVANAKRIRTGMTLRAVEAILGKTADDYEGSAEGAECWWSGAGVDVIVVLDEGDKVTYVSVYRKEDTGAPIYSYP
jgi:hypothetical protein